MSAATLTRPEVTTWSTYQPYAPRPRDASGKPASVSTAAAYKALLNDGSGADSAQAPSTGFEEIDALFAYLIAEAALRDVASDSDSDETPNLAQTGMELPSLFASLSGGSQSGGTGDVGTGAAGDANVGPISGGNPAGIAESVRGQSAAGLMSSQRVPMNKGVPTDECCANFVSACLVKSGLLPASQHSDYCPTLKSTLQNRGWHTVSRSQAKPGDVCFVIRNGVPGHVELVAKNDNGRITLVGSNNTQGGSGPQVVSNDTYSGNQGNVVFLSPP